jgi:glutamate/tyrosine decarboxylase-like PLP-dependent enzyme
MTPAVLFSARTPILEGKYRTFSEGMTMVDRKLLERTLHIAASYLESLPGRPVGARSGVEELRGALRGPLPEEGADPESVIREMARDADGGLVASAGPRYFGFVTGGSVPAALAADWLASAWDQNAVLSIASPAAGVVEEAVSDWILELLDLPRQSSVGLVTGCQMANFTCLAAARHEVLKNACWDVEASGLFGAPQVTVIAGEEAHATLFVALRMLGLGTGRVIRVPADGQGRMDPAGLERALEGVCGPTIVCLQAGNVNTGAFDPCGKLIPMARAHGAWVHVDGAFGLWGRLLPALAAETAGIEQADSWATDAHKWLNVPYDSGIAIVKNEAAHRASMVLAAPYYIAAPDAVRDPSQWVPESSRRARGFPLYAAIRSLGRKGLAELVERNCRQARLMADLLREDPRIEIANEVVLNQVLVRFLPEGKDCDIDAYNRKITALVQEEGTCWAGGSAWKGRAAMRISVSGWPTNDEDIRVSAAAIREVLSRTPA